MGQYPSFQESATKCKIPVVRELCLVVVSSQINLQKWVFSCRCLPEMVDGGKWNSWGKGENQKSDSGNEFSVRKKLLATIFPCLSEVKRFYDLLGFIIFSCTNCSWKSLGYSNCSIYCNTVRRQGH